MSLGKPKFRRVVGSKFEFTEILCDGIKFDLTEMWCDVEIDKRSLLCTVVHLHLPYVTAFLTFVHRWNLSLFIEIIIKWRQLTEAAPLLTCAWEVPGSNLDQDTGYNFTSDAFVNLYIPTRKIGSSQSTQPVSYKFFSIFHPPTIRTFDNIKFWI
jgi:hypothetical protein